MEGVGGGSGSELFGVTPPLTVEAVSDSQPVEAASPISSRPPASSSLNYEELIRGGGQMAIDDDALVGEDAGGGGGSAGNRWPRQETLALLKIRSDMDSAFRDATLKGPLWDEVSRKLGEMGYVRNAKKCKEKFENVQKYYKRTKEGRGGRGDGKTYKFFTQLEALHNAASQNVAASGFGISNPTPISAVKISQTPMGIFSPPPTIAAPMGVSFSSYTSSSSTEEEEEEEEEEMGFDVEGEPSSVAGSSRKRRRRAAIKGKSGGRMRSHKMMMGFFEGLMKEVLQKQEAMQQRFLEAIERREEERMMREETWKRQEMGRLREEQEKMAQERTISGSRDAAIIAFLQKFTGQTIQLPSVNISPSAPQQHYDLSVPVPAPTPVAMPLSPVPPPPPLKTQPPPNTMPFLDHPISSSNQESSHGGRGDGPSEPISSRWPKPEVLALIKLRGGLESRYQEMGPKGPLWEEISAGMNRLGYKRSAKRCKEKWENINKYFKKVKESNKKRREDSKTCPYFDELDALYRKKIPAAGGSDGGGSFCDTAKLEQTHIEMPHTTPAEEQPPPPPPPPPPSPPPTKPEDIVSELMELQNLYDVDQVDDEDDDDDDDNDNTREEKRRNMDYKMEFQTSEFQSMAVVQ